MDNTIPIKINSSKILFSKKYLGLDTAEIWIGVREEGPADDDDERVLRERREAEEAWRSGKTKRPSGISAFTITDTDNDGYYELGTLGWEPGLYRLNYHGPANVESPAGQKLNLNVRDLQYAWAVLPEEVKSWPGTKEFTYLERNNRGYCFRIKVNPDNSIEPAGSYGA